MFISFKNHNVVKGESTETVTLAAPSVPILSVEPVWRIIFFKHLLYLLPVAVSIVIHTRMWINAAFSLSALSKSSKFYPSTYTHPVSCSFCPGLVMWRRKCCFFNTLQTKPVILMSLHSLGWTERCCMQSWRCQDTKPKWKRTASILLTLLCLLWVIALRFQRVFKMCKISVLT